MEEETLSKEAKSILIQSVTLPISYYAMQINKLPTRTIEELKRLDGKFFFGGLGLIFEMDEHSPLCKVGMANDRKSSTIVGETALG